MARTFLTPQSSFEQSSASRNEASANSRADSLNRRPPSFAIALLGRWYRCWSRGEIPAEKLLFFSSLFKGLASSPGHHHGFFFRQDVIRNCDVSFTPEGGH